MVQSTLPSVGHAAVRDCPATVTLSPTTGSGGEVPRDAVSFDGFVHRHVAASAPTKTTTDEQINALGPNSPWFVSESKTIRIFRPSAENTAENRFGGGGAVVELRTSMVITSPEQEIKQTNYNKYNNIKY